MSLADITAKHVKRNKIELLKEDRSYKEALEALEGYAAQGYASIVDADKSYFLKCFGIFDRPATPERFMLRVRIPGGRLTAAQAAVIGEVAKHYGNDYIDLTTRMQVQLRYLRIEDIPVVLRQLDAVGITTYQTGVDNFRNILCDPLEGEAFDNIIDAVPLMEELQALFMKKQEWIAALPRKFNTAVSGSTTNRCNLFAHDCCFALAQKEGEYGFNVYLGGKVGAIAQSADRFVTPAQLPRFFEALITVFRDYGFRDNRNKNRIHYLIAEAGMPVLLEAVEQAAGMTFATAGVTLVTLPRGDESAGRVRMRSGENALTMVVPAGIFSGTAMIEASMLCERYGNGSLRISTTQNIYLLGIKDEEIAPTLAQKPFDKYPNLASSYFNHMVACAGKEHCPFGVIPNKPDAIAMAQYLESAVPLEQDAIIRMHWSGCVKGCGVHEIGDIGFEGCKAKHGGESVFGVHISLGGKSVSGNANGYTVLKAVPLERAYLYVEQLACAYRDLKLPNESFELFESRVLSRFSHAAIEFILRWNTEMVPHIGSSAALGFDTAFCAGRDEWRELFEIGQVLYTHICGVKPFDAVYRYEAMGQKPVHAAVLNKTLDPIIGDIVMKMIAPGSGRYEVFSELLQEMKRFAE